MAFDDWGYIVAKEKTNVVTNIFIGPFGHNIWLAIFSSFVATFTIQIVTIKMQLSQSNLTLKKICLVIKELLASFLDQLDVSNISNLKLQNFSRFVSQCNWFVWVFAMIILSSIYKGERFSNLTKIRDPQSPTTLESLVNSKLDVYTFQYALPLHGKSAVILHINRMLNPRYFPAYYPGLKRAMRFYEYWREG